MGTDPSYLGNLDINTYSSSSPGLNGSLTPFAHTNGLYFNDEPEPQNQEFLIAEDLNNIFEEKGNEVVRLGEKGNAISYYDSKYKVLKDFKEGFSVNHPRDENYLYIDVYAEDKVGLI